jgi:K+-sensing histidine kinase KdpD
MLPLPRTTWLTRPKTLAGVVFCVASAILLTLALNDEADFRLEAPLICLFAVLATAFLWGRRAAIFGSLAANLTFCIFLFPPVGSLQINDPLERIAAIAFQLSATCVAFLAPPNQVIETSHSPSTVRKPPAKQDYDNT